MTIIPDNVLDAHLSKYDFQSQTDIKAYYQIVKMTAFAGAEPQEKPCCALVVGSPGAGKTTKLSSVTARMAWNNVKPVICDADALLENFSGYRDDRIAAMHECNNAPTQETFRKLIEASSYWHKAAEYLRDRLVNDAVAHGYPLAIEVSGQAPHFSDFMKNLHDAGYKIDLHFCDAPLFTKLASCKRSETRDMHRSVSALEAQQKDVAVRSNMATFAAYADEFTLHWRDAQIDGSDALHSNGISYSIGNLDAVKAFNRCHAPENMKAEGLAVIHVRSMQTRDNALKRVPAMG